MEYQHQLARPEPFTVSELEAINLLKARFADQFPDDLLTDFSLARQWRACRGDCAEIEQRLRVLATYMRAFDFDLEKASDRCLGIDFAVKVFERFAISRLDQDVFSGDLLVFLQRMEGVDIKQILRVVPLGHILHTYVLLQLNFMRAVHAHERRTGRQAALAVVIDLQGLPFRDFINPLSASSKMARLIVRIWSEYFTENLIRLYLVHPPALVSIMWQIIKHIADQETQSRIVLVPKGSDLLEHLHKSAIPEAYGGERRDDSGFSPSPSTCVSRPLPVLASEHFSAQKWWEQNTAQKEPMPDWTNAHLKGKGVCETAKIVCCPGDRLLWLYSASGNLHFEVVLRRNEGNKSDGDEQEIPVWPKALVTSLSIPEHGYVDIKQAGTYLARFSSAPSTTFGWLMSTGGNAKISYIVHRVPGWGGTNGCKNNDKNGTKELN